MMSGKVRVRVMKGTDLVNEDYFGKSDPYVKLTLRPHGKRTKTVDNDLNPTWNEEFEFPITHDTCLLKLEVWDEDPWPKGDDYMGDAEIDLKPLMEKEAQHKRVVFPSTENCLCKDSYIIKRKDGKTVQEACLRLRNVEKGLLTLRFEWPV